MMRPFPVEELRPRFSWLTCFEPEDHLDQLADRLLGLPSINKGSVFAGFSFKDDSTLRRIKERGYSNIWRLDPQTDLALPDPLANIESFQANFTEAQAKNIVRKRGAADVFIARHVLEHAHDSQSFLKACRTMVKPGGFVIIETPDCTKALGTFDYTMVWEEHNFYFTPLTLRTTLSQNGIAPIFEEIIPLPFENSLVMICALQEHPTTKVISQSQLEKAVAEAKNFANNFKKKKSEIQNCLKNLRTEKGPMVIWGAGHLSAGFLALMEVQDLFQGIIDQNSNKINMRMPIGNLHIHNSDWLVQRPIRSCFLGANPQHHLKILSLNNRFIEQGGTFYTIFGESHNKRIQKIF